MAVCSVRTAAHVWCGVGWGGVGSVYAVRVYGNFPTDLGCCNRYAMETRERELEQYVFLDFGQMVCLP